MTGLMLIDHSSAAVKRLCFLMAAAILMFGAGCSDDSDGDAGSTSSTNSAKSPKTEKAESPESEAPEEAPQTESTVAAKPTNTESTEKIAPEKVVDPSATGSFFGTVVLDGDAPTLAPLAKADDENLKDKEVCGMADVPDESLLIGEGNGIANVFVYLRRAPKGFQSEAPSAPIVLDQKGCVFTPHVALIQAGQKVLVKSSDNIQHNIHTFPARNQGTNLLINPNEQVGVELTYSRAESDPLQVKCDIHSWMSSYHLVLDHPFMTVTDANGKFSIDDLPAGDYQFRVWHEKRGLLEKGYKATVTGTDAPAELKYAAGKFAG